MFLPKIEPPYPRTTNRGGLDSLFSPLLVLGFAIKLYGQIRIPNPIKYLTHAKVNLETNVTAKYPTLI